MRGTEESRFVNGLSANAGEPGARSYFIRNRSASPAASFFSLPRALPPRYTPSCWLNLWLRPSHYGSSPAREERAYMFAPRDRGRRSDVIRGRLSGAVTENSLIDRPIRRLFTFNCYPQTAFSLQSFIFIPIPNR